MAVMAFGATLLLLSVTGCAERLFYIPTREATPAPQHLSMVAGGPVEELSFHSADGTRLRGWFIPARGVPSLEALTVVHVHGNAGSMLGHIAFSSHFPAAGFNLLIFDFRGYGESEGQPRVRQPLIEDAKAAVRTARERPGVDPSRVALYGHSLGGGIAINVLAEDPALLGAVLESPIASWRLAAATALSGDPPSWWARWLATLLVGDECSPLTAIAGISQPILILHGDEDRIVPVGHGRRLAEAGRTATLVEIRGGEHNTLQETHPRTMRLMHEFLGSLPTAADE
jgi:hypothetical protein